MNYTTYTDVERVTLDAHRTLSRAEEAATAAANLRRFAALTKGKLPDVGLTTATIEAADVAFHALIKAAANISLAKRSLECSTHRIEVKGSDNV